jgi:hypothetical protein
VFVGQSLSILSDFELFSNMSGTLPPLQQLSPDNEGPVVVVVAYILVSLTILFSTIRVITFHTLKRGFGLDDAYLSFAAVWSHPMLMVRDVG